ncbi:hypothetical protein BRD17_02555 [Halobacteriales archaeon SW_7_68_16]|nr:MAG: hypothetical protein BRD17_02555 [Halobacteriales archaeon SW_7_68_16]
MTTRALPLGPLPWPSDARDAETARDRASERQVAAGLDAVADGGYWWADSGTDGRERLVVPPTDVGWTVDRTVDGPLVTLPDPWTATRSGGRSIDSATDRLGAIAGELPASGTVVLLAGGVIGERLHAHLMDTSVQALGYDFVTAPEDALYLINEYRTKPTLGAGLVGTGEEPSPSTIHDRVRWIRENTPAQEFDGVRAVPTRSPVALSWPRTVDLFERLAAGIERVVENDEA